MTESPNNRGGKGKPSPSVIVSIGTRALRDSEPDPDFDPEVISQISPLLRKQLTTDVFSRADEGVPLEPFEPQKSRKSCNVWRRLCSCCSSAEDQGEEDLNESFSTTLEKTDSAIYPYDPQPTMESTNLHQQHKVSK